MYLTRLRAAGLFVLLPALYGQSESPSPFVQATASADVFWSSNFNQSQPGLNLFHNFDDAPGLHLNAAGLTLAHDGPQWGFEVDAGAGEMFRTMNIPDPWHGPNRYIAQAFVSRKRRNLTLDFGKFYSNIGAEAPESFKNFNYTRSLLYVLGEPYDHFGMRATMRVSSSLSLGTQLVNGWNDVCGRTSGRAMALTSSWTRKKWGWSQIYMFGGRAATSQAYRKTYNSVLTATPTSRLTGYLEFLYASERASFLTCERGLWTGLAAAGRYSLSRRWSAGARIERFDDRNGVLTEAARRIFEDTLTLEYRPSDHYAVRAEVRRDWSGVATFPIGSGSALARSQDTFLVGMLATWKNTR